MCRELPRSGGISRLRALCITISDDRGDESFADDLNMGRGIVSGRVALLLRSTEIRPHRPNDLSRPPGGGSRVREGRGGGGKHLAKMRPRGTSGKGGREASRGGEPLYPHPHSKPCAPGRSPRAPQGASPKNISMTSTSYLYVMRSYQGYYTRSHQNSEVKRLWAGIVLGWVTSREVPVLHPFCSFPQVVQIELIPRCYLGVRFKMNELIPRCT